MTMKMNLYIVAYFMLALLLAPIHLLSFDTYYYWDWSRHLALSYFDGAPMIAYFIKLGTLGFGDTLFALSLVGIVATACTAFIIYQTGRLFLTQKASTIAVSVWLFSPLVTFDLLNQTTLNTPMTLFWALTVYFAIHYLTTHSTRDLYCIGVAIGLMMLSKYSGIVLVLALGVFVLHTPYRRLYKSVHLYLALFIAFIFFSPVLIWNYQHQWQSFIYQLHTHALQETSFSWQQGFVTWGTIFLSALNVMLLVPWVVQLKLTTDKTSVPYFCLVVCIFFLLFYMFMSFFAQIRGFWLEQYLITACLLVGYCYEQGFFCRAINILIVVYGVIGVAVLINATTIFNVTHSKKVAYYQWMQQFNARSRPPSEVVITTGWFQARLLFFLKDKPYIYTLDCGSVQNQYELWSQGVKQKILHKEVPRALYLDTADNSACIKQYFDHCEALVPSSAIKKEPFVIAYECVNYL